MLLLSEHPHRRGLGARHVQSAFLPGLQPPSWEWCASHQFVRRILTFQEAKEVTQLTITVTHQNLLGGWELTSSEVFFALSLPCIKNLWRLCLCKGSPSMCRSDLGPAVLHIYNGRVSHLPKIHILILSFRSPNHRLPCCLSGGSEPKLSACFNESVIMALFKN